MAFALTGFRAYGVEIQSVSKKRGVQRAELHITAAATDIDLDIGDPTGTFWTAVGATTIGDGALETLQQIATKSTELTQVQGTALLARLHTAAAGSAGEYALAVANELPNITWHSGDAPTDYTIQLEWLLNNYEFPVVADLSTLVS